MAFSRHEAVTTSVVNFAIASLQSEVGSPKVSTISSSVLVTLSASPSRMNTSPGLWRGSYRFILLSAGTAPYSRVGTRGLRRSLRRLQSRLRRSRRHRALPRSQLPSSVPAHGVGSTAHGYSAPAAVHHSPRCRCGRLPKGSLPIDVIQSRMYFPR